MMGRGRTQIHCLCLLRKWFEPRSNIPWLKKIIWVMGVLRRTVVSDWRFDNLCGSHLTLKMASAQVVETLVTNNSPSQDSNHPNDLFQSRLLLIVWSGCVKYFLFRWFWGQFSQANLVINKRLSQNTLKQSSTQQKEFAPHKLSRTTEK